MNKSELKSIIEEVATDMVYPYLKQPPKSSWKRDENIGKFAIMKYDSKLSGNKPKIKKGTEVIVVDAYTDKNTQKRYYLVTVNNSKIKHRTVVAPEEIKIKNKVDVKDEGFGMGDMSKDPKRAFKGARWTVTYDEDIKDKTIKLSEIKDVIKELVQEMEEPRVHLVSPEGNVWYLHLLDLANMSDPSTKLISRFKESILKKVTNPNDLEQIKNVFNKEFGGYQIKQFNDIQKRNGEPQVKDAWEYYSPERWELSYKSDNTINESNFSPKSLTKTKEFISNLIFSLKDGDNIFFSSDDKSGHLGEWIIVEKVVEGDEYLYRWFGKGSGEKHKEYLESDDEIDVFSEELSENPHINYYSIGAIQGYVKRPYDDQDHDIGDYERNGPDALSPDEEDRIDYPDEDEDRDLYESKGSNTTEKLKNIIRDVLKEVNYTTDEKGNSVIAVGATTSIMRFIVEHPEMVKQMREWVKDIQWKEDSEEIDELSDVDIVKGVQKHYEGGINQFVKDTDPTLKEVGNVKKGKNTVGKPIRKSETNEWVVKWYVDGKPDENKTYYTDDKKDAFDTYLAMLKNVIELNKQKGI